MSTLFVSHGAPTLAIEPGKTGELLRELSKRLPTPAAILVISAHWDTPVPTVSGGDVHSTIHDFGGFPPALYALQYPAPGAPWLAEQVMALFQQQGLPVQINRTRGLDHGAWVPLRLLYPQANIPVVQISIQSRQSPAHHWQMGRALKALHAQGVLILASGAITHNLYDFFTNERDVPALPYVTAFAEWVASCLARGDVEQLMAYQTASPDGARAHPSADHILPLFVALGVAEGVPERFQPEISYGMLAMDSYLWCLDGETPDSEGVSLGT